MYLSDRYCEKKTTPLKGLLLVVFTGRLPNLCTYKGVGFFRVDIVKRKSHPNEVAASCINSQGGSLTYVGPLAFVSGGYREKKGRLVEVSGGANWV